MVKRDLTLKCAMTQIYYQRKMTTLQIDFAAGKKQKKSERRSPSCAITLWLNYIQCIHIVQAHIRTEKRRNWSFDIVATKCTLNLFAATGRTNYAKTCRLYIQFTEEMQQQHPLGFEQFLLGNHIAKRFEKNWEGNWTDLSIEQILIKYLKDRGGVIGRGMSENILRIWTENYA